MSTATRVLYVDDSRHDRELVRHALKRSGGFVLTEAASRADFEAVIGRETFDVVLTDFNILGFEGLQVVDTVRAADPHMPVVVVTGTGSEEIAVEAMKRGAADYVIKSPERIRRLPLTLAAVVQTARLNEERRRAEQSLREAEEKYRLHFQNVSDVIYSIDSDLRVVDVSPSVERTLGFAAEDLVGRSLTDLRIAAPASLERMASDMRRILAGEPVSSAVYEFVSRDGTCKWGEVNGTPVHRDGVVIAAACVARDITERRQLEEQLLQARKMESVGRLAGGIAHDFNNLLAVIIGYAELAMEKSGSHESVDGELGEILSAARRSADITRQLLTFARKLPISPRILDLNRVAEELLTMLGRLIGEHIELVWRPRAGLWKIYADPVQIQQVLSNLCVNSRDAIEGPGRILIETDNVVMDESDCRDAEGCRSGEFVALAVTDDGHGMGTETIRNIFDPFFTTKDVDKGTGLGLASVHGIVRQNNGFITVVSEEGRGTTFRIYLPRHVGDPDHVRPRRDVEIPRGHGETILLVEDESAVLALGRTMLETLGYTVLAVCRPQDALDRAAQLKQRLHLLVTDMVLPEMGGRKLAERIEQLCPGTAVLFVSGYPAGPAREHGVLEDGVLFLGKPYSMKDLAIAVYEALHPENCP